MKNMRNWLQAVISLSICALLSGCGTTSLLNFHNSVVGIESAWLDEHNQDVDLHLAIGTSEEQFIARYNSATLLTEQLTAINAHLANLSSFHGYSRSADFDSTFVEYVDNLKQWQRVIQDEDIPAVDEAAERQTSLGEKLSSTTVQNQISAADTALGAMASLDRTEIPEDYLDAFAKWEANIRGIRQNLSDGNFIDGNQLIDTNEQFVTRLNEIAKQHGLDLID
jgi:hypothetical protein